MVDEKAPLDLGRLTKMAEDLEAELSIAAARSPEKETKCRAGRAELLGRVLVLTLKTDEKDLLEKSSAFVGSKLNDLLRELGIEIRRTKDS